MRIVKERQMHNGKIRAEAKRSQKKRKQMFKRRMSKKDQSQKRNYIIREIIYYKMKRRNGLKVVLCFGRANKVFFPFFNKISCKLSFQESVTKGSNMFCLAIKCCCSRAKILQKQPPKKFSLTLLATLSHNLVILIIK